MQKVCEKVGIVLDLLKIFTHKILINDSDKFFKNPSIL